MRALANQTPSPASGPVTRTRLNGDNRRFRNTGGVSANNRAQGFRPAFLDTATGRVYSSRFANGSPAPMHLLDGLPETLISKRAADGSVISAKASVVAGFVREHRFYTRDQAAASVAEAH